MGITKGARTAGLASLAALGLCPSAWAGASFQGHFSALGPNKLITNEYAYWNPYSRSAVISPDWELTSGSLFSDQGRGWTGVPDDKKPDASSSSGNNSTVFRLTTKRDDFKDAAVSFRLLNRGLHSTPSTPEQPYDGVHIFLRYQTEYSLYCASVNRREGNVVIKKKVPGGKSNGGTYYELSRYVRYAVPYGDWQDIRAEIRDNPDGSVAIALFSGKDELVSATDDGSVGGAPIKAAGKVGVRADNAEVLFDYFKVKELGPGAPSNTRTRPAE